MQRQKRNYAHSFQNDRIADALKLFFFHCRDAPNARLRPSPDVAPPGTHDATGYSSSDGCVQAAHDHRGNLLKVGGGHGFKGREVKNAVDNGHVVE